MLNFLEICQLSTNQEGISESLLQHDKSIINIFRSLTNAQMTICLKLILYTSIPKDLVLYSMPKENQLQLNRELNLLISYGILVEKDTTQITMNKKVKSILETFINTKRHLKQRKPPAQSTPSITKKYIDSLDQLKIILTKKICRTSNSNFSGFTKKTISVLSDIGFIEKQDSSDHYYITDDCVSFLFYDHFESINFLIKCIFNLHKDLDQSVKEEAIKFINTVLVKLACEKIKHTPTNEIIKMFIRVSLTFGILCQLDDSKGNNIFSNTGLCYQHKESTDEEKFYFVENSMKIYFVKKNKLVFRTMEIICDILHFEDIENNGAHNFVAICELSKEKIKVNSRNNKNFNVLILNFLKRYSMNELNSTIERKIKIWCNY